MAYLRNLSLLQCLWLSLICFNGSWSQAQSGPSRLTNPQVVLPPPAFSSSVDANPIATRFANANPFPSAPATPWMPPTDGSIHTYGPTNGQGFDIHSNPAQYPANFFTYHDPTYDLRRIDSARRTANEFRARSLVAPVLNQLALQNANLAEQWAELAEKINTTLVRLGEANTKLNSATRDYEDVGAKLRQYGLTPTIGLLLSHKKSQLEDWQVDSSADQFVNAELQRAREMQLSNGMIAYDGSNVVRQASDILALAGYGPTHSEYAVLAPQIQLLLRERSEWLRSLTQGYNDYRQRLGELDSASTAFSKLTDDYRKLVNRHVTWIRSNEPIATADFRKFRSGLSSLFDSRRTEAFVFSLTQKWSNSPSSGWTLVGTLLIVFLARMLAKSWLLGKRMRETTATTRKCIASLLTPLVALGFPGILYLIARWLGSGYVSESTLHVASGLYAASFVALIIEVPRQLLRTNGFVERYLKIDLPRRQRAAVYLFIIGSGLVLSAYLIAFAEHIDHGSWSGSVARLGFIVSLLLVAWTAHLALKPSGGFLEPLIEKFGGSVLYRIRFLYYFFGVGFPVAMVTLSALGYQFTATEIIKRAGIMFVSILVGATLWSALKILASGAWHALTGTRDESRLDEYDDLQTSRVSGALAEHSLELKHQIAFLSQCALILASVVCVGWLWIDIFPNARFGNPVLWSVQDTVTQSSLDASGQKVSRTQVETTPITALRLVLAAAALFVAFQLAKLLPGIFDALVLQRVNFDEAMEHLTLVLGRCLLFGAGCFIACRLVGLRWEMIQWMAVGLTIGLGFAMQDIVRNLLGGMVVLFEKPARLGDLITVGSVTGRVAAQKLRTTVLSDEEGREVIIPNKNFVSQDVTNWMGAGRLTAIPIEVAVTRDVRPADVCRMLQQLLVEQPDLLLSPAPQATLVCISQKSQRIELRAWVEEDHDASSCRDALLKIVLGFLTEQNLLAAHQPRQPSLKAPFDRTALRAVRKKRSA
jgi:potassium-dependent mechanosensitive channel